MVPNHKSAQQEIEETNTDNMTVPNNLFKKEIRAFVNHAYQNTYIM